MSNQLKSMQWPLLGITAIAVFILGYLFIGNANGKSVPSTPVKAAVAAPDNSDKNPSAPDFTLPDLEGNQLSLSDYKDKVIFINFWATWCPPCRAEIPYFIDLVNQYGDDGFVVLGIALDPREFDKVAPFVEQMNINYPVVLDKNGVQNLYGGIGSIPTTFVVNRNGEVVDQIVGSRPKAEFERIIKKWL